jgi:SAM-dependent methyltransferase
MSMTYYASLIGNMPRIEAFRRGIPELIQEGERVLEVGSGLGTFAFFAAKAGAGHVWAVESAPVAHVSRALQKLEGLDDAVTIIRGKVPEVDLPEPVDVLIFEDYSVRLLADSTFRLLRAATEKYLKPGGRLIPGNARIWLAPLGGPDVRKRLFPGGPAAFADAGLDWEVVRLYLANRPGRMHLEPGQLLADAVEGPVFPLHPMPSLDDLSLTASWTVDRPMAVDALTFWFDLGVTDDAWVVNGPGCDTPWGQTVLPLDPPLEVPAGGTLHARVAPTPYPDGAPGWLAWTAECGQEVRRGNEFAGDPYALDDLYPEEDGASGAEPVYLEEENPGGG